MEKVKIKVANLKRTNLGTPSVWEGKTDDGKVLYLYFRHGRLRVEVDKAVVLSDASLDEFDVSGYLSDENLTILLRKHELLDE